MEIIQIANGYKESELYKMLFIRLDEKGVKCRIYVPVLKSKSSDLKEKDDVFIDPCFSKIDRMFFFPKQRKIIRAIEEKYELRENSKKFIVHAHTMFSAGYTAYILKRKYKIPYVVAIRNTDIHVFLKYMKHLKGIGQKILINADRIIFLSYPYKQYLKNYYKDKEACKLIEDKSDIIPNGINSIFLLKKISPKSLLNNKLRLIYVGEISKNKNVELSIEVAKMIEKMGIDVTLALVGNIMDKKYINLIKNNSFVKYYERCNQEQIIEHLNGADIFIMPSHTETFGLVYAEAISQGIPVLYTRGQGFDGQFPEGLVGYSISDIEPMDAVEKIQMIICNYDRLSKNCIKSADKFDWNAIAERYKEIYEKVSDEHYFRCFEGEQYAIQRSKKTISNIKKRYR